MRAEPRRYARRLRLQSRDGVRCFRYVLRCAHYGQNASQFIAITEEGPGQHVDPAQHFPRREFVEPLADDFQSCFGLGLRAGREFAQDSVANRWRRIGEDNASLRRIGDSQPNTGPDAYLHHVFAFDHRDHQRFAVDWRRQHDCLA